jgi:hypothetical protein
MFLPLLLRSGGLGLEDTLDNGSLLDKESTGDSGDAKWVLRVRKIKRMSESERRMNEKRDINGRGRSARNSRNKIKATHR